MCSEAAGVLCWGSATEILLPCTLLRGPPRVHKRASMDARAQRTLCGCCWSSRALATPKTPRVTAWPMSCVAAAVPAISAVDPAKYAVTPVLAGRPATACTRAPEVLLASGVPRTLCAVRAAVNCRFMCVLVIADVLRLVRKGLRLFSFSGHKTDVANLRVSRRCGGPPVSASQNTCGRPHARADPISTARRDIMQHLLRCPQSSRPPD